MQTLILNMDLMPKMSFYMLLLCLLVSLKNPNTTQTHKAFRTDKWPSSASHSVSLDSFPSRPVSLSAKNNDQMFGFGDNSSPLLEYDFYRDSCPHAEQIVRATVRHFHNLRPEIAPSLIRLAFHGCFIQFQSYLLEGCDASILIHVDDGIGPEKESPPIETLKGFDVIEMIKSKLEDACPGVVSCADILVLAARDSAVLVGGPFYPLYTGRRDGSISFSDLATEEIPSSLDDISETLSLFASRGFHERETVALLGAHSIGVIHCKFFEDRLYNFKGTNKPDPSLDNEFLSQLRSTCSGTTESSSSASGYNSHGSFLSEAVESPSHRGSHSSVVEPGMDMELELPESDFGTLYYHSLLQHKGTLYADQQLMAGEGTQKWVKAYAFNTSLFRRNFALVMMKLSDLRILTNPLGHIRINYSKAA